MSRSKVTGVYQALAKIAAQNFVGFLYCFRATRSDNRGDNLSRADQKERPYIETIPYMYNYQITYTIYMHSMLGLKLLTPLTVQLFSELRFCLNGRW